MRVSSPWVEGAADTLAVQRHPFPAQHGARALGPARPTVTGLLRIQGLEEAVVGVVFGRAVAQAHKGLEPRETDLAELFHVVETLSTAQDRTEREDQEVLPIVIHSALHPRIGNFRQEGDEADE